MILDKASSPIFGEEYPYPTDGKAVLRAIALQFAAEFNQLAKIKLGDQYSGDRVARWIDLSVNSAYPTTVQQCPRISIQRKSSQPKLAGLGGDIETRKIEVAGKEAFFRIYRGQLVTDTIEVAICTLNEQMRDDLYLWFQQYVLDAITWSLPQIPSFYYLQCTNALDDLVEYQGGQGQPGFEFYIAQLTFTAQYDLMVLHDVDQLKAIVNWQQCLLANQDQTPKSTRLSV